MRKDKTNQKFWTNEAVACEQGLWFPFLQSSSEQKVSFKISKHISLADGAT